MGEVVLFRPKPAVGRPVEAIGGSAEILFFMGVRIVRIETEDAPARQSRRRSQQNGDPPRKRRERR